MSNQAKFILTMVADKFFTFDTNRPISQLDKVENFYPPITRLSSQAVLKRIGPIGRVLVKRAFSKEGVQMVSISKYQICVFLCPAFGDDLSEIAERLAKVIKVVIASPTARWLKTSEKSVTYTFVAVYDQAQEAVEAEEVVETEKSVETEEAAEAQKKGLTSWLLLLIRRLIKPSTR